MLNTLVNILIALCAVYRPSTFVSDAIGMRIWSRRLGSGPTSSYELQLYLQRDRRYRLVLLNLLTRDKRQFRFDRLWSALMKAQAMLLSFESQSRSKAPANDLADTIACQEQPFGAVALSGAIECTASTMNPATPPSRTRRGRLSPNFVSSTMLPMPAFSAVRRWRRH